MLIFPTIPVFHHASSVSLTMSHYMYVCIQHTPFAAPAMLWWWWWCSCHCLHLLSIVLIVFWKCNISFSLLLRHTVIMSWISSVQQKYVYIYLPDSLFVLFFNFKAHMVSWTHVRLLETPYVMVEVLVFFLDGALIYMILRLCVPCRRIWKQMKSMHRWP